VVVAGAGAAACACGSVRKGISYQFPRFLKAEPRAVWFHLFVGLFVIVALKSTGLSSDDEPNSRNDGNRNPGDQ